MFYYEFSLKTSKIHKLEIPCYLYRQRKSSVMHSHNDERSKKYYLAMREMLRVYKKHLEDGDDNDLDRLQEKIHHSEQNVATCLASVLDRSYVKEQLKILKKGVYPFAFRKAALLTKQPLIIRIMTFLIPLKPFFWFYHMVYRFYNSHR